MHDTPSPWLTIEYSVLNKWTAKLINVMFIYKCVFEHNEYGITK